MPEQKLDDVLSELQAGSIEKQILTAIKQISFNTVNNAKDKVPKGHTGEITLKITISNGTNPDTIIIGSSVKTRIPTISGKAHAAYTEDADDNLFFVDAKNGYISINPIQQDDIDYNVKNNVSPFNTKTGNN